MITNKVNHIPILTLVLCCMLFLIPLFFIFLPLYCYLDYSYFSNNLSDLNSIVIAAADNLTSSIEEVKPVIEGTSSVKSPALTAWSYQFDRVSAAYNAIMLLPESAEKAAAYVANTIERDALMAAYKTLVR